MAVACRIIGILPPCQITWVKLAALPLAALPLRELLQDLLEHLRGIILAALVAPRSLAALAALLLLHLLKHLLKHLHELVEACASAYA
jgi:hypothetical protein